MPIRLIAFAIIALSGLFLSAQAQKNTSFMATETDTAHVRAFWTWFSGHEAALFASEGNSEATYDLVSEQLQKVHPDLAFEFGSVEAGRREFVISAGGIKEAFPSVRALASTAPKLPRWRIIAFRPRRSPINVVEYAGYRVNPKDVTVCLLRNGNQIGINIFIPGYTETNSVLTQIAYLLLDEALGELAVETQVGLIARYPPEAAVRGQRIPLAELPAQFDSLVKRIRTGA